MQQCNSQPKAGCVAKTDNNSDLFADKDSFDLQRFVDAQQDSYQQALAELKAGQKTSHWMWYIFPQLKGLGRSQTAQFYAISSSNEAQAYLAHPLLGRRLHECCEVLLGLEQSSASRIFGSPDDMKLKSSMTLFSITLTNSDKQAVADVLNDEIFGTNVFDSVLNKFYAGQRDKSTVQLLNQ